MVETIESTANCPLCGDAVDLSGARGDNVLDEVLANREKWSRLTEEFRARRSLHDAARAVSVDGELARKILLFICTELCGCRTVTCTSCFDDYRNEL